MADVLLQTNIFHRFPEFPKEIRLQIWEQHFSAYLHHVHIIHLDHQPETPHWATFSCTSFPPSARGASFLQLQLQSISNSEAREVFIRYHHQRKQRCVSTNVARDVLYSHSRCRGAFYGYLGYAPWGQSYNNRTKPAEIDWVMDLLYLKIPVDLPAWWCPCEFIAEQGWSNKVRSLALVIPVLSTAEARRGDIGPLALREMFDALGKMEGLRELYLVHESAVKQDKWYTATDEFGMLILPEDAAGYEEQSLSLGWLKYHESLAEVAPRRKFRTSVVVDDTYCVVDGRVQLYK